MDMKNVKGLGNRRKVLLNRKSHITGAACKLASQHVTMDKSFGRHCKRVRSGGCKNSCRCSFRKSVVKNYSNFMKSGLLQRVMFYQNGEWKDLPEEILSMLKGDFQAKKAIIEVVIKGQSTLFDFLHMVLIDTETGLQQPIAWIDVCGSRFFPELYSDVCQFHPQLHSDEKEDGSQKIELHLEIAFSGGCISKSDECDEASISHAKRLRIDAKLPNNDYKLKQEYNGNGKLDVAFGEGIGENVPSTFSALENCDFDFKHGQLDRLNIGGPYNRIQNMFLASVAPFVNVDDIVGIFCGSPTSMLVQARLQYFDKQVEIMKAYRGNANVRSAWFACSKEVVSRIMLHRFEHSEMQKLKTPYGSGIHLIPTTCSSISTNYFDADENDTQYMLLCRVIMGNMELIHSSEQFCPSNENYDSGVDDLQNPKKYVIWDTHMNLHIYPEYAVSFRIPPKAKEPLVVGENRTMSGITHSPLHCSRVQCDTTVGLVRDSNKLPTSVQQCQENAGGLALEVPKTPTSPWLPFPLLINAIKTKIPRNSMALVDHHYDKFKRRVISRVEFIKQLRSNAGDDVLRATIKNLQSKYRPVPR